MLIKSALVAKGTFVVCEYDASTGSDDDLNEISRKVLAALSRTRGCSQHRSYVQNGHTFTYLLDKDRIFLCSAAEAAGSELVFQFLKDFRLSFEKYARLSGGDRGAEMTRMLKDLIGKYNSGSSSTKVQQMEQELEDVTGIMRDNLGKVMERGERIESLLDKTALLRNESVSFRAGAKRHNDARWWQDSRGRIMLGICALVILTMVFWNMTGRVPESGGEVAAR